MKKLLIFLMIAIPLIIIIVVNLTVNVVAGFVSISVDSISLNQTQIEATIEEVISLEANILPKNASNKDVIWQSTNEEVAKVDSNGNVSFLGFGKGYITATTVDGNKTASCYFFVTDTNVHQVTLSSEFAQNGNFFAGIGQTLQLQSIISPTEAINKNVYYLSEDENIATVDSNGLVYGLREGRVKITAVSEQNETISDSIIVEVVKPLEYISVKEENIVTSAQTYQISYDIYPEDATITSVLYSSSDESIATVSSFGLVTFKKEGEVTIYLTSVEGAHQASIDVSFTDGYARDLILDTNIINASINDGGMYIQYTTLPQSVDVDVEFLSDNENVAYVDDSGYAQFIGGGSTLIRARILSAENVYIEKIISIYIESPATAITIEDEIIVATKSFKLNPISYPATSTNNKFFYFSNDTSIATVSEDGTVTFVRDLYSTVDIDIYANEKNSNVKKRVRIIYTNGYPVDINLAEQTINVDYGSFAEIEYTFSPANVEFKEVKFEVILQENNSEEGGVVEVSSDGSINTLGGGRAIVEVSTQNSSGEKIKKNVEIIVTRKVEDVEFVSSLDKYNGEYVTALQEVQFSLNTLTLDATNKAVSWSLNSSEAIKSGENMISFNGAGTAEILIYSLDGNFEKTITIRYLKETLIDAKLKDVPTHIEVGESFEFEILRLVPFDANIEPIVKISNQLTTSSQGKVFELSGKKITAVGGGTATISLSVGNLQYVFVIEALQKVEEIVVNPANITTTSSRISLSTEVLPVDASNKNIEFEVDDTSVAEVVGGVLVFYKNGRVNITAKAVDGSAATYQFWIEKVDKGAGDVTVGGEPISMQVGDSNILNLEGIDFEYVSMELNITKQESLDGGDVIELTNNIVKALSVGSAEIECILTDAFGSEKIILIEINVIQLCEDIQFVAGLDEVLGEFVSAKDSVNLSFNLLPNNVSNKNYAVKFIGFSSTLGSDYPPYINDNKQLIFAVAGVATVEVASEDGAFSKQFKIRYTGGDALSAELNISDNLSLQVGESVSVEVSRWIPHNTQNTSMLIREVSHSQGVAKVIDIKGSKITAVAGGTSKVLIELSNGIIKEISITVVTLVTEIKIEDEITTSNTSVALNPTVLPIEATNKALIYSVDDLDIAYIRDRNVVFSKPGTVNVLVSAADGSGTCKTIKVTSTFGYANAIEINLINRTANKNSRFTLRVTNFYPQDIGDIAVQFKVISQEAADGSENDVVRVSESGSVECLYGGVATVRVYTLDYYGNEIYKDCVVTVLSPVTNMEIKFDKNITTNQGSFVVGSSNLGFEAILNPVDASNRDIRCESSDETIAVVNGNQIKFLKAGQVVIKFIAEGSTNESVYVSHSFYYTQGQLISLTIDESRFENKVLALDAGEKFEIKAATVLPVDIDNIVYTIENRNENPIDISKKVMSFENGVITALNGGSVSFDLKANGILIGRYTVKVFRKANAINLASTEVYIRSNTYEIIAKASPSDTYQTGLIYEVIEGAASVDSNGKVTLNANGVVKVKISLEQNEDVYNIITIEYSNEVKRISFNETVSQIYVGHQLFLNVISEPFNVNPFEVVFESSDESIASVNSSGRVLAKDKAGEVTISAYVKNNPQIRTERTFTVALILSDIELELDEVNDNLGIGGYRVWGNLFETEKDGAYIRTYQMKIKSIKPANSGIRLVWKSDNEAVAKVDQNGLVFFVGGTGKVKITVEPEVQYDVNYPLSDSYTFNVVSGANVYTYAGFYKSVDIGYAVVLQNDINAADISDHEKINLRNNIYGNGKKIDFSGVKSDQNNRSVKIVIETNNVIIDNVIIRGTEFETEGESKGALSQLEKQDDILRVGSYVKKVTGVELRHSLFENAYMGVVAVDSEVKITGCIIQNTFSAGLLIRRSSANCVTPPEVTLKDCLFSKSLLSSILFDIEQNTSNLNYKSKLTIEGNLYLYNWIKVSEFNIDIDTVKQWVPNANAQIKTLLEKYPQYIYNYAGEDYIMLGISSVNGVAGAGSVNVIRLDSVNEQAVFKNSNPYENATIGGLISLSVGGIPASADLSLKVWTLPGNRGGNESQFIKPNTVHDYTDYKGIRQI